MRVASACLFVAALLLAGTARAGACEDKCVSDDKCFSGCSDQKCMSRCQSRASSCISDCMKNHKAGDSPKPAGMCPGPGGKMVRCDTYSQQPSMTPPDHSPKKKDNKQLPNRAPTAEEIEKMQKDGKL